MNRTEKKLKLLEVMPHCTECGCTLQVSKAANCHHPKEAVLKNRVLVCFQCHRLQVKKDQIESLPFLKKWKKKIDVATGFFSMLRQIRIFCNQFYYFKIRKGEPTTRLPFWMRNK